MTLHEHYGHHHSIVYRFILVRGIIKTFLFPTMQILFGITIFFSLSPTYTCILHGSKLWFFDVGKNNGSCVSEFYIFDGKLGYKNVISSHINQYRSFYDLLFYF